MYVSLSLDVYKTSIILSKHSSALKEGQIFLSDPASQYSPTHEINFWNLHKFFDTEILLFDDMMPKRVNFILRKCISSLFMWYV